MSKREILEPNHYLVYLIDKGGRRWYSPRLVEEYSSLEATKLRCKEFLAESDNWERAEISELVENVVAVVELAPSDH